MRKKKYCPNCGTYVEVVELRDNMKVSRLCPHCGFIFISYEPRRRVLVFNNEPVPDVFPFRKTRFWALK